MSDKDELIKEIATLIATECDGAKGVNWANVAARKIVNGYIKDKESLVCDRCFMVVRG